MVIRTKHITVSFKKTVRLLRSLFYCFVLSLSTTALTNGQIVNNNGTNINITRNSVVDSRDVINNHEGTITNNGTINLSGSYRNNASAIGNGLYRLMGDWINTGIFNSGTSEVLMRGSRNQDILSGNYSFFKLSIANNGTSDGLSVNLLDTVTVSDTLVITTGNIDTRNNLLYLSNYGSNSLQYLSTTKSRIFGRFQRGIGEIGRYLFPLGGTYYNPITLTTNETPDAGTVLAQFFADDPGSDGLPLADPPVEIWDRYPDAYWRLTPGDYFISENYNIELGTEGFADTLFPSSRLIKRERGGAWTVDGIHMETDSINNLVRREGLRTTLAPTRGTELAVGRVRPLIIEQPTDTAVCEGQNAIFKTTASGIRSLRYQWYRLVDGSGQQISRTNTHYSGARTDSLTILNTTLADAGYYFCLISDRNNNIVSTDTVYLHISRIPVITVTTADQPNECSDIPIDDIHMVLSNFDDGTRFVWTRSTDPNISTMVSETGTEYDIEASISGLFVNYSDAPITITFEIIPIGPDPTSCTGEAVYSYVTINPIPRLILADTTMQICDNSYTAIELVSPTEMTKGSVVFDYTAFSNSSYLSGNLEPAYNQSNNTSITRLYTNSSDTLYSIFFNITPKNNELGCYNGTSIISEVKVHPRPLQAAFESTAITCEGVDTAEITVELSKVKPSIISWIAPWVIIPDTSTYEDTIIQKVAFAGTYTVTVQDNMNCSNSKEVKINEAPNFSTTFMARDYGNGYNTSCYNSNDGIIRIGESAQSAITPPCAYQIIKMDNNTVIRTDTIWGIGRNYYQTIENLAPGWYQATIQDANGCINIVTTEVKAPAPIKVSFDVSDFLGYNVSCNNYNDGSVRIDSISGGSGIYTYRWYTYDGLINTSNTADHLDNIPAGTYYLEITDQMGCTSIDSITLVQPDGMILDSYTLSISEDNNYNISCNGNDNGAIEISVVNGSGDLTYTWAKVGDTSFSADTKDISSLTAGTYVVSVHDGNNCELRMPVTTELPHFTLTEPEPLRISATTSTSTDGNYNISCNGGTGSIDITVFGGGATHNFMWQTNDGYGIIDGEEDQSALTAGTYHLTINDINGCSIDTTITLTEPSPIVSTLNATHITCNQLGSIDLTIEGGVAPYSHILWSNGATTEDIDNLDIGMYTVTFMDANGCIHSDSIRIENPPAIEYLLAKSNYHGYNISCNGMSNGWINITPTNGKAPYTITLLDETSAVVSSYVCGKNSTTNIANISAGTYTLHIIDDNLCETTESIYFTEPDALDIIATQSISNDPTYNIACYGDMTGSINISVTNAVGNVEYLWSDGETTSSRDNLAAGRYSVVVIDENSCKVQTTVDIIQPQPLGVMFTISNAWCADQPNGSIEADIVGGAPSYSYQWSNGSTELSLDNVIPDTYMFTATDMNGCQINKEVIIEYEHKTCLEIPNAISPNGDLINDEWHIKNIDIYPNIVVKILNRWGTVIWQSEKGYPTPWDGRDSRGRALPMDSYHYIIDYGDGKKPEIGSITIVRDKNRK